MLLGVERAVVEDVGVEQEAIVVSVRPKSREKHRCGVCGRRCPREDAGEGRRRWRALDLGTTFAYLEADAPRVYCKDHRVVVAQVPWARHDSRFTIAFEDQCCWLAVNTSKKAVAQLMRVTWRTVGSICERVAEEATAQRDLLTGLKRIGIDDFSHRKGHRYLTVVNHTFDLESEGGPERRTRRLPGLRSSLAGPFLIGAKARIRSARRRRRREAIGNRSCLYQGWCVAERTSRSR